MKKALILTVLGLLIAPQAGAQTQPAVPMQPGASAQTAAPMQPGPQDKCDVTSPVQSRACLTKNIQTARKAIDRKIAEACKQQVMSGGKPAKGNEILACRADRLAKIAAGIN